MENNRSRNIEYSTSRDEYMQKLLLWIEAAKKWQTEQIRNIQRNQNLFPTSAEHDNNHPLLNTRGLTGFEYIVPPLWRRVIAEVVDFGILFLIKTLIVFSILESLEIISPNDFGIDDFNKHLQNSDLMYHMSLEFLILELLHRVVVFIYETLWSSLGPRATPGKMIMGLMIVQAVEVQPVAGREYETIRVYTGNTLSFREALLRSLMKSLFMSFALPFCFAFLFFKHNRTGYDLVSHTIVVKADPNPPVVLL